MRTKTLKKWRKLLLLSGDFLTKAHRRVFSLFQVLKTALELNLTLASKWESRRVGFTSTCQNSLQNKLLTWVGQVMYKWKARKNLAVEVIERSLFNRAYLIKKQDVQSNQPSKLLLVSMLCFQICSKLNKPSLFKTPFLKLSNQINSDFHSKNI